MKEKSRDSKAIELQQQDVGLPGFKNNNHGTIKSQQNRQINKQNLLLKKELQTITVRLDQQIKKRLEKNRRPWSKNSDERSYIQLQNAYKKCEIYKRQASFFKKRLSTIQDESKHQSNGEKINEYIRQNAELKNEIKSLNKLIKNHQKTLVQIGSQEYAKILKDNEKLKQENRKLKKSLSEYRLSSLNLKQHHDNSEENSQNKKNSYQANNNDDPLHEKLEKSYQKIKGLTKQNSNLRQIINNYRYQLQEKEKQLNNYRQKINNLRKNNQQLWSEVANKRNTKMHYVPTQKQQQKDSFVQNYKRQPESHGQKLKTQPTELKSHRINQNIVLSSRKLASKAQLKKKISSLSNNRVDNKEKMDNKEPINHKNTSKSNSLKTSQVQMSKVQNYADREEKKQQSLPNRRIWKLDQNQIEPQINSKQLEKKPSSKLQSQQNQKEKKVNQEKKVQKEKESKQSKQISESANKEAINLIKWNDEAFNSKIKEVEVIMNQNQDIKDINVRYVKGGPKKYSQTNEKYKSSILICSQHQYITVISGIFQHGYLQFLSLTTNNKRTQHFGKKFLENKEGQIQPFEFQAEEGQFIGALHGQKNEQGIIKIGYAVLKE